MTAVSRTAQFAKIHKILKKHYKPTTSNPKRSVIEHLIFACCLEDACYEAAEEAFAALMHTFFDWNEVRVTSISELSEVMACLPDPRLAANRIKRVLHAIFEAQFKFDLEDKRKKNLGPTIKWLQSLDGATQFCVGYVVQAALGGHSIPLDKGALAVFRLLDLITDKDLQAGAVPGLERAIAKARGVEFGSLLHQFGADFTANPYSPTMRSILLEINPDLQSRLPKRRVDPQLRKKVAGQAAAEPAAGGKTAPGAKGAAKSEKTERGRKSLPPQTTTPEPSAKKSKKKSVSKSGTPSDPAADTPHPREISSLKKKSVSVGLSKRKPR
jgi:endonuclease III